MSAPLILVVDDQPINVQLLRHKLERAAMRVATATDGRGALLAVQAEKPDLILLDVMMPDMDGIEVCMHLQESEENRDIPVIFVTARTSKEAKIDGLAIGAVDYITKPVDLDEMLARVKTQLRFSSVNREKLALQRRLAEARRAATIGAVTEGISHNMNNILGVALGYLDILKASTDKPERVKFAAENVDTALKRVIAIIRQVGTLAERTKIPVIRANIKDLIENSIQRFQESGHADASITVNDTSATPIINTHYEVFEDALSKLLLNAWESYSTPAGTPRPITIEVSLAPQPSGPPALKIAVEDQGRGVPAEIRDHIFEPFVSSKHTVGVGMGLTVVRQSMRDLGGQVHLEQRPGAGTRIVLVHPLDPRSGPVLT